MNKAKTLRRQLGTGYTYTRLLSVKEARQLQAQPPPHFTQRTVAILRVGCLKLEQVLFGTTTGPQWGYDLFVKDDPAARDWIYYGSPDAPAARTHRQTAPGKLRWQTFWTPLRSGRVCPTPSVALKRWTISMQTHWKPRRKANEILRQKQPGDTGRNVPAL